MAVGGFGVARAYGPTLVGLKASAVGFGLLGGLHGHPILAGMVLVWRWVPALVGLAALSHGAWVTWQLLQAELGSGLLCNCGGPLGAERDGRYGPYRRCRCCGKNIARRYYEHMG